MPAKPVKFGLKLWILADSLNGFTYDFEVYTGKDEPLHENGLGFTVLMKLNEPLLDQSYHFYFDNFYTSPAAVKDLYKRGTPSCGTITEYRKGLPDNMKDGKSWARKKQRCDICWERVDGLLAVQWKDNKVVTMLLSIDVATEYVKVEHKRKIDDKWDRHCYNKWLYFIPNSPSK